jgi:endonuclease-8
MPEGDTIFRAARTLQRALAGRVVTRFESAFPALTRIDADGPIAGRTIESVASRGKHLLMAFSGDLVLRTHMRMNGSWHIYRSGERWRRPARDLRILVATDAYVAVAFNVPVAEFIAGDPARHAPLAALGPDLAAGPVDRGVVRARIRARGADPIADVLLDQRVVAGLGNVLKSEVLFASGVQPFTPVADLGDAAIDRIVEQAERLMVYNIRDAAAAGGPAVGRRTTGRLNPAEQLWVYGRGGRPCLRCGTAIAARKTGADARITYWCPRCQA